MPNCYKKNFGDLKLTLKELHCLSLMMMNHTQKEIANTKGTSQTAVRKTIRGIKRKLGNEKMPKSLMFKHLQSQGVLLEFVSLLQPQS